MQKISITSSIHVSQLSEFHLFSLHLFFLIQVNIFSPALSFLRESLLFSFIFLISSMVWGMSSLLDNIFIAMRTAKYVLIRNSIFNILKIPLAVYILGFLGAFGIFTSWGIAMIIANSIALVFFLQKSLPEFLFRPKINMPVITNILHFSLGNYIAYLLYISPNLLLPIIILNILGPQVNAYYYVTFLITDLFFIIPNSVSQSLFTEASHAREITKEMIIKSLKMVYILMIPIIVIVFVISGNLLNLFGSNYSEHGSNLLKIFAISGLFLGVNVVYLAILRLKKKVKEIIAISGFLAMGILGLSFELLSSTRNIISVGYAWLLFHGLLSIYTILSINKIRNV